MARDAYPLLGWMSALCGVLALVWLFGDCGACAVAAATVLGGMGAVAFFFRDPHRDTPAAPNAVISAADGRVLHVREVYEPEFFQDTVTQVAVFMSPLDVHVNRIPLDGTVALVAHHPGRHGAAFRSKADAANEHALVAIKSDRFDVLVKQIAGSVARRIVVDVQPGDEVKCGRRLGMIRFGSRVDLLFPRRVRVKVAPGYRVKAGVTVIGET